MCSCHHEQDWRRLFSTNCCKIPRSEVIKINVTCKFVIDTDLLNRNRSWITKCLCRIHCNHEQKWKANVQVLTYYIYWAKVLTDHPKHCDSCFVVQYFGMNFGTLNENTIWHQYCASAGIRHSACSLRMRIHIKPLKFTYNSRNDLNRNSNHENLNNNVFSR